MQSSPLVDQWLSQAESRAYLKLSRGKFDQLVRAGEIPAHRLSERILRFNRQELDEWAASHDASGQKLTAPRGERGRFTEGR